MLAASTGIVGATVVTMGLLSLPTMIRRGYDKPLACGSIAASGTAQAVRIDAVSDWQPALGQQLVWRFDGRADLGTGEITADRLAIATETLRLTGSGLYALETGSGRAELEATYPDLGALAALLETEVTGRARLAASVTVGGPPLR